MTYYARPISSRAEATGVTTWLWAGHDGLRCSPDLPGETVPTGHLWGWGPDVQVHLREDPVAPTRGILVQAQASQGSREITAMPMSQERFPRTVTDRHRFLHCATPADAQRFEALKLDVIVVVSPTHAVLVADRSSLPPADLENETTRTNR